MSRFGLRSVCHELLGASPLALVVLVSLGGCGTSSKKKPSGAAGTDGGAAGADAGAAGAGGGTAGAAGADAAAGGGGAGGGTTDGGTDVAETSTGDGGDASDVAATETGDAAETGSVDGGGDVTEGGTAACDGDSTCNAVAGSLAGLLWKLPCGASLGGAVCAATSDMAMTTLAGTTGATYDVTLRFRGIVEQKTYTGGCSDGSTWLQGGADNGDGYNVYKLTISSPPQTYFLNTGASNIQHVFAVDFQETVRIDAGATVTLVADPKDGEEIINVGTDGTTPVQVAGVSLAQPYNGQFIQMDVVALTTDPVATSATVGAGSAGSALAFDGSMGQMVMAPDAPSLEPTSLTLESWFTFSTTPGSYAMIAGKTFGGGSADSIALWYESGALHAGINAASANGTAAQPWTPVANEWHHAAMVFDNAASKTTLYVDGQPVSCLAQTGPVSYDTHAVILGADIENGSPNGFWYGSLDEVRLFSTVRTPAQVWADMHTHQLGATTGLAAEWTFDEGSGQTTADHSGTGNTATLGATSAAESTDPSWVTSTVPH